jgi:hypothetical protein
VRQFLRSLLMSPDRDRSAIQQINTMRSEFSRLSDDQLRALSTGTNGLIEFMADVIALAGKYMIPNEIT